MTEQEIQFAIARLIGFMLAGMITHPEGTRLITDEITEAASHAT